MTDFHDQELADLDEAQFEDYQGDLALPTRSLRWTNLLTAPVVRGLGALVFGVYLLARPRDARLFAMVLAAVALLWAAGEVADELRAAERSWRAWIKSGALVGVAVVLLFWPGVTDGVVARIAGWALIGFAAAQAYQRVTRRSGDRLVGLLGDAFAGAIGVALLVVPETVFSLVLIGLAVTWIVGGVAALATGLRPDVEAVEVRSVWTTILEWIEGRPNTADDRTQLYQKLFYEGPSANRRLSRFAVLMGFATAIASYGIASDSTAVVVGAMLIAPLMTPLMGTSVSIIMGWPKRATMSALVALGGIFMAVGLAFVIGGSISFGLDPMTNSQIASRITPSLIDLAIAVAAGGAGAFALSRPDVSDALPGVAVAIALVPPLAVVGLMLRETEYDAAWGALLLFTTNAVAILLTGALVFILTGVVPIRRLSQNSRWIRSVVTLVAIFAMVIAVALSLSSARLEATAFDQRAAEAAVADWVGDQELDIIQVRVTPSTVRVAVSGPERPPPVADLAADLERALSHPVDVEVSWIPQTDFVYIVED